MTSGSRSAVSGIFFWPGVPRKQCAGKVVFQSGCSEISEQPDWKTTFPAHCLRGTPGQKKIPETALRDPLVIEPARSDSTTLADRLRGHTSDLLFLKHRFDVFTNENVTTVLNLLDPEDIVLYGVATDVCDKAAVEGPLERRPHTRLFVVTDAIRGIDRDASEQLLREWGDEGDRKSTRLNSSHSQISYAVFCLKKKRKDKN